MTSALGIRAVSVGECIFKYDLAERWCSTVFPDGRSTEAWSGENESEETLDKYQAWGYERSDHGVAVGLIEHEASHSLVTTTLLGLPWSPELFAQAHGHISSWRSVIPAELRPWASYSIPLEEALVISVAMYIRAGSRHKGWNKAFPDTDPLDWIGARTDLAVFLAGMRARLDGLWERSTSCQVKTGVKRSSESPPRTSSRWPATSGRRSTR